MYTTSDIIICVSQDQDIHTWMNIHVRLQGAAYVKL